MKKTPTEEVKKMILDLFKSENLKLNESTTDDVIFYLNTHQINSFQEAVDELVAEGLILSTNGLFPFILTQKGVDAIY